MDNFSTARDMRKTGFLDVVLKELAIGAVSGGKIDAVARLTPESLAD